MKPNLLMRAWMMAHVYGAEYQAVVCYAGSDGDVAFRESLCPQYTTERHDAKGIRTYHITGTCGGTRISRIACGRLGGGVAGADDGPLHITITSNTNSWQEGDLSNNRQLVSVDLDMERAATLPSNFLSGCASLQRVQFTGLWAVEVLQIGFLYECRNLREVDLSPFTNVKIVGSHFLSGCTSACMKSIDLTPLRAVEVLPLGFLHECSGLEKVDLSPLVNLREVGYDFLSGCTAMTSIDLTPLRAVEELPYGFLFRCSGLREVDLSPLIDIKKVGDNFLSGCSSIRSIDLTPLRAVEELAGGFLNGCSSLEEVDLSPLVNLKQLWNYFLSGCSNIKSIDLTPLRAVAVLPYGFLNGCSSLEEVDLSPLVNLTGECVEGRLQGCASLKAIRLAPHQPACVVPESLRGLVVVRESNEA